MEIMAIVHVLTNFFKVPQGSWGTLGHLMRTWILTLYPGVEFSDAFVSKTQLILLTNPSENSAPDDYSFGAENTHEAKRTLPFLPGYVEAADKLKSSGIKDIICVSVNDPFVMAAWGENQVT